MTKQLSITGVRVKALNEGPTQAKAVTSTCKFVYQIHTCSGKISSPIPPKLIQAAVTLSN